MKPGRSLFDFQTIEVRPIRVVLMERRVEGMGQWLCDFARKRNTRGIPVKSDTRNKLHFYECSSLLSFDLSTRSPMKSCLITNVAAKNKGPNEAKDVTTILGPRNNSAYISIHRMPQLTAERKKKIAIKSSPAIPGMICMAFHGRCDVE